MYTFNIINRAIMGNAIVIIAPNKEDMLSVCLPSVERFAAKHGVAIEVVSEEEYGFKKRNGYNFKIFEKFQVQKFTDKYDRILRIDVDVIFSPDCPNVFDIFDPECIAVVYEDHGRRRRHRRQQMNSVQKVMGEYDASSRYFNAGIVLTSKCHSELYNVSKEYLKGVMHKEGMGKYKEQNLMNWRVRNLGYCTVDMGYKFNHMRFNGNPQDSYIVHFAGRQDGKIDNMKKLYNYWYA